MFYPLKFCKENLKYSDLLDRYDFRPIVIETFGAFGSQALELIDSLAAMANARTGDSGFRSPAVRRLSAAVQAGNARLIVEAHSNNGAITKPDNLKAQRELDARRRVADF
jgi:hypothetical protein